jgi:hypothetical protein
MKPLLVACSLVALALGGAVLHADPDSGPKAGDKVPALKATAAYGDDAGKELDLAALRKGKPTLYVFVRADKFDRPMFRFLKTLNDTLKKDHEDVRVVAVWLTEDAEATKSLFTRAEPTLKLLEQTTFGHAREAKDWNVNGDAHLTVVVAEDDKVSASLGFTSLNETDVKDVVKKLKPKK